MSDIESQTTAPPAVQTFVRQEMQDAHPAPISERGAWAWMQKNLFSSWANVLMTVIVLYLAYLVIPPLIRFAFIEAVWTGSDRTACATEVQGGLRDPEWFGACWAYVGDYFKLFIYGRYPIDERWRVDIVFIGFVIGLVPLLMPSVPFKRLNLAYMFGVFPIATLILLTGGDFDFRSIFGLGTALGLGGFAFLLDYLVLTAVFAGIAALWARMSEAPARPAIIGVLAVMGVLGLVLLVLELDFGLSPVRTSLWGGLLVTLVIAVTGIVASLPLGIVLALGRRSEMPIVRLFCIMFIEFWRGVPLITVLFMSSVVLPLFLPEGVTFDKLLRAVIGVALFASAYMAEVIRGGLQAIPKGQYEGAMAMGLTFSQMMRMIVLPQALTLVIPGIVNTFIGLFKDTTLVLIIGLFDFLGMIQTSYTDSSWSTPVQSLSGYLFAAFVYFCFCFAMSRYSIFMERRLDTGHKS